MNTNKQEYLSAWLDNEAGGFEGRRMLGELCRDKALGQTMSRYALIGEVMRAKKTPAIAQQDFLERVQLALDDEPVYQTDTTVVEQAANDRFKGRRPRWYHYGMAAAVSAAFVGGMLLQQNLDYQANANALLANNAALPTAEVAGVDVAAVVSKTESVQTPAVSAAINVANATAEIEDKVVAVASKHIDPQTRDLLNQYVTQHMRYASTASIVPSLRAVSYFNDY